MSRAEPIKSFLEEGHRLRKAGDRNASLAAFQKLLEYDPENVTAMLETGYDYLQLLQIDQARCAFENVLRGDAANKAALIGLGHTFRHLKLLDEAERQFRRALDVDPGHTDALLGLAYTLRSTERLEEALSTFQAAALTSPTQLTIKNEVISLLRELGRPQQVINALREIVALEPDETSHLILLAQMLQETQEFEGAIAALKSAIALTPRHNDTKLQLSHLLLEMRRFDEAENLLNEVLADQSDNISALNALGYVFRGAKRPDEAVETFHRILEIEPRNADALRALGLLASDRQNHEEALTFFTAASQLDPDNSDLRIETGRCLQHIGRFSDAKAEFERVLTVRPTNVVALMGLGYAKRDADDLRGALSVFDDASLADPHYVNAPIESGHTLLRLDNASAAEQRFRLALNREPNNLSALIGLSYALRRLGLVGDAEAALRNILAKEPDHVGAMVALGHLLESLYRLDESADLFLAATARDPKHADSLASLGNIHRRRGSREEALSYFRRAADADVGNLDRLNEVAVELRDLGRLEEANQIIDTVLMARPHDVKALMQRGLILRRQDKRDDARSIFSEIIAVHPGSIQAFVELAVEECALGCPERAEHWITRALVQEPNHLMALLQQAEIMTLADNAEGALNIYRQAMAAHPANIWPWLNGARAAFESGDRVGAFDLIQKARDKLGPHPEMAAMEVELLRQLRDWDGARNILQHAENCNGSSFWLWTHRIQIEIQTANYDTAQAYLEKPRASNAPEFAHVALLRGQLAEAQLQYQEAIFHYREAIRLNPADPWAHFELSRAALLLLDLNTSRSQLLAFTQLTKSSLLLKGQSVNLSQNHVGQLLDEFQLDAAALNSLRTIRRLPLSQQFEPLKALVRENQDYTPASILAAIALRQGGFFSSSRSGDTYSESPIPKHIVQFWDADPPSDVVELMGTWQQKNPTHSWACFDDESARRFLDRQCLPEVLWAYRHARQPAQKADIFRLAYLSAQGGIYIDADDRCLAPLDSFIRSDATLVVHQENYGSIGNNFVAATPEHPVLRRALELAVNAMNRGDNDLIWLSTGPGLLTRAFAIEWAEAPVSGWLQRTQVMSLGELQRVDGIHCPVRYKKTGKHWSRTSFGQRRLRLSAPGG